MTGLPKSAMPGQKHVGVVVQDNVRAEAIVAAIKETHRFHVTLASSVEGLGEPPPDAVVMCMRQLEALRASDPRLYMKLSRRSRLVLSLPSEALLDSANLLSLADAWVFEDINAERIADLIDLGLEGHCLIPARFLSRLGIDEIRGRLVPRLTPLEFQVLVLLSSGLNNHAIAQHANQSEAVVKSLVRSVLTKLHFRNRTEAGVFAARQQQRLEQLRHAS